MTELPVTPTYPGVYIEELPSSVKTITGVSTSITAFIGRALAGPIDQAILIHSFSDYDRIFAGLWSLSSLSYAVYQYFLNGGTDAIVIRAVNDATPSTFTIGPTDQPIVKLQAANPGAWANDLEIEVDNYTDADSKANPDLKNDVTLFKLKVELARYTNKNSSKFKGRRVLASEEFQMVSTDPNNRSRYIKTVLENQSDLIRVGDGEIIKQRPVPSCIVVDEDPNTHQPTGTDGHTLTKTQIYDLNNPNAGLGLLEHVDLFNMLCIPPYDDQPVPTEVYEDALVLCKKRRAMLIVDSPKWKDKDAAMTGVQDPSYIEKDANAVLYFPSIYFADPLDKDGKTIEFPASAIIAGMIATTDSQRGVWKSPAGVAAPLTGLSGLSVNLTDEENGDLNPLGINCLRAFPGVGFVAWGARTLRGADNLTDQWKYMSVRRTALYIEESLYRGTQWVVFEPNDERLWGQIRLNVGAFMQDLFLNGAFQGSDPAKAYMVKCDSETTTQNDIDKGIVNILVGFAPLKPAEFVILQISQLTQEVAA